jgi:adenosylhomocysteine nucleosidase
LGSERGGGQIGVVVGLIAEARIARRLGWEVGIGGGTAEGAAAAAERLAQSGNSGLVSFGLAGGLDPALRPGAIIVPSAVWLDGRRVRTDAGLAGRLGGATGHILLAGTDIASTAADKAAQRRRSGADALDLETGGLVRVAEARGLPFAVLRVICDPAQRTLPEAALASLDSKGGIALFRVLRSLARHPSQLRALLALALDAGRARSALARQVGSLVRSR